jgi:hypothetical protein
VNCSQRNASYFCKRRVSRIEYCLLLVATCFSVIPALSGAPFQITELRCVSSIASSTKSIFSSCMILILPTHVRTKRGYPLSRALFKCERCSLHESRSLLVFCAILYTLSALKSMYLLYKFIFPLRRQLREVNSVVNSMLKT